MGDGRRNKYLARGLCKGDVIPWGQYKKEGREEIRRGLELQSRAGGRPKRRYREKQTETLILSWVGSTIRENQRWADQRGERGEMGETEGDLSS